jgi:hypothetical protein
MTSCWQTAYKRRPGDHGRTRRIRLRAGCSASTWTAPDRSSLLTLDGSSVQTAPDGSSRIVWMIIGMIKEHPTEGAITPIIARRRSLARARYPTDAARRCSRVDDVGYRLAGAGSFSITIWSHSANALATVRRNVAAAVSADSEDAAAEPIIACIGLNRLLSA